MTVAGERAPPMEDREGKLLMQQIARVLDECRSSYAIHTRKLKELLALRSSSPQCFFSAFSKTLTPLFDFQRRTASAERIVRFVAVFSAYRDDKHASECDVFLEEFLRFLLIAAVASNKTARFRSCQIISEIIMRLPDDAEVSNELWDEVIDCMKLRVGDRIPAIRTFAVRGLARFANDLENSDIVDLFLQTLPFEQNAEVRKTIVISLPPSNATSAAVIGCTLDVSESVRRAAYFVLGNKFPLQSLSIKLRTIILQRGLADRAESVKKDCLKMLKDEWLVKCCNGDPIDLLKFLDVETYESVGEAVMGILLKAGMVNVQDGQRMRQFFVTTSDTNEGQCIPSNQLMEAEVALYWRTLCRHLQNEAQEKGTDAAATMGTEAVVYAAEASDNNDLLEQILPATVSDYIQLVKAHLAAGPNYRFVSRQLLLLGVVLNFSDATNRKVGAALVQELLHRPLEHEIDDDGNKVVIGDGINLGGDREWATAVSELARKVHASVGEFEEVVVGVVEELARPCRERTADYMQWMHCLAVTGLLLENVKSIHLLQKKAIEPVETLQSLLLPGAKHVNFDVQRVAMRCLGLFGLLERKPSEELVKQLRHSFVKGPNPVSIMASKALVDLGMWHGPQEVDKAMCQDLLSVSQDDKKSFAPVNFCELNGDSSIELLDLLYAGLDRSDWDESTETDDHESVQAILGEGFAKILLLSENYASISISLHPLIFAKLINLYFSDEAKELQSLKQCLSVFFEHYPALSSDHKKCISKAFIPVMRSMWPGIYGNAGGYPVLVSNMRKRATKASRFMMQMMQTPLYPKENEVEDENGRRKSPETPDGSEPPSVDFDSGEEGLAICIAMEMVSFPMKKTAAGKSYVSALCRIVFLLNFRSSEQRAIKCMRGLLNRMAECISTDKELLKDLKRMGAQLKALDEHPDEDLSQDQADLILGRLELDRSIGLDPVASVPSTPATTRSTRPTRSRRRVRREDASSDEGETSPTSVVPPTPSMLSSRSQRASKIAALSKMKTVRTDRIEGNEDENDAEVSDVTSEEASDESDEFIE
ncbi:condensin complex subunit 3 [Telopea speciosissima]|uniref:condensin complex subunit 3 n=1 Tax=Telopea speciosissima TaxID=54955 RepID=UPI001CC334EA|nr:condensin complex subunit 3 [Telopea speciosissima]